MAITRQVPSRIWLILPAAALLLGFPAFTNFYLDWLWFGELGYRQVFLRSLTMSSALGAVVFAIAFAVLYANLLIALSRIDRPYVVLGPVSDVIRAPVLQRRQLRTLATVAAAGGGVLLGLVAANEWLPWLRFMNAVPFGIPDPVLGRDAGFYVFTLPVLQVARGLLVALLGLSFIGSAVIYVLAGILSYTARAGVAIGRPARRHLSLLAAGVLMVLAFGAWLDMANLLVSPAGSGVVYGASYADIEARLPALRVLMVFSLAGAGLAVLHAFSTRLWPIVAAIGLYVVAVAGGVIYANIVQRFIVSPNEQVKERPFIINNVEGTRRAFAINQVEEHAASGDATLTQQDIQRNAETLENVRLWDHQPLLDTFGQLQEIRTYYDFTSVDNDRYMINGKYRQIMLSARELNSDSLPNRTWINERLTFTHGYGLTLGPVNQVTSEGLPELFIKNLPPESTTDLTVSQPSIYFGEISSDHVFVGTHAREFDYPKGDDNVYSAYAGTGGVPIGGLLRRVMFSVGLGSFQLLFSNDITAQSRVLYHRNITDRLQTIAPFLTYDPDPYLVVSEGRLFWIRDAYTTTDHYPYSTPSSNGGINYIRNSVKVVIDAYNGTTTFYLADDQDPLALTLAKIFPGLFRKFADMPPDLRRHVRYPETLFAIQAAMYSTYHMTNPAVFYNKEDQWDVPAIDVEGTPRTMEPYYTIMKLPGDQSGEFIQMLPLTPRRKDNLAAWMVARSDGAKYGHLMVFQFPKQKIVFGPRQIVARINQDQLISPQITLWNQQGSQVIQGTLLVIPIEESMLYIRPMYLRGEGGRIPELKRVIVAYQNQIVMEETLDAALNRIFGRAPAPQQPAPIPAPGTPPSLTKAPIAPLAQEALDHYRRALDAQRQGNWGVYGEEIKRVGETLEELSKTR